MEPSNPKIENPTSTHSYDGKLLKAKEELIKSISQVALAPKGVKLEAFDHLRTLLERHSISPSAHRCFDAIVHTFTQFGRTTRGPNYDPSNDLYADDLLFLCYEKAATDEDFVQELIIQLEDMASGLCAQGRTTRLFQILLAYKL